MLSWLKRLYRRPLDARSARVLSIGVLAIICLLPYCHTLAYPFVWDDAVFIEKNPAVLELAEPDAYFIDRETLSSKRDYNDKIYRPLRTLVFALVHRLFGLNPAPYRLLNLSWHVGCTLLLFSLGLKLTGRPKSAFIAALVFAVHPLHAEAVTWISSLADVMSTFFFLLAVRLFVAEKSRLAAAAVLVVLPLALLSKEPAVVLPVVLALCLVWRENRPGGRTAAREWVFVGAAFVIAALYFVWRAHVLGRVGQMPLTADIALFGAGRVHLVFFEYLKMLVLPHPLCSLRAEIEPFGGAVVGHIVGLAALMLFVLLIVRARKHKHVAALFGAAFIVSLLPVLNLIPVVVEVAERFAYLPSVWFCLLVGEGIACVRERAARKRSWDLLAACIALVFGMKLVLTNLTWQSNEALYLSQVSCINPDPNAYWNLGNELVRQKRWKEAEAAFSVVLSFDRSRPKTLNNLAFVYLQQKRWNEAEAASRKSLATSPEDKMALNNLGAALLGKGKTAQAVELFRRIVDRHPDDYLGQLNLGIALSAAGDLDGAKRHFEIASRLKPSSPTPRELLGRLQEKLDKTRLAPSGSYGEVFE